MAAKTVGSRWGIEWRWKGETKVVFYCILFMCLENDCF